MRVNWLAIIVSTIVFFLLGWLWYAALGDVWAASMGTTRAAMMAQNTTPYPYVVALVAGFCIAYGLARALSWHAPANAARGAFIGLSFGLLFVGTSLWLTYAYEHRTIMLGLINTGYIAIGMAIMGAIIAAWRPKSA